MTDIQYHSAMSSVGSTNTIDEFFSCDEEDSDSRSSSRTKSNPDHIEIEIDEDSTNTTNTTQIITTRATSVQGYTYRFVYELVRSPLDFGSGPGSSGPVQRTDRFWSLYP